MRATRVYTVYQTDWPVGALDENGLNENWQPEGWLADPEDYNEWVRRHGDTRFFWPAVGRIYKSRSSAKRVADTIRAYGGDAQIFYADVVWQPIDELRASYERKLRDRKIARLEAELAELKAVAR